MKKQHLKALLILPLIFLVMIMSSFVEFNHLGSVMYDLRHRNPPVVSKDQLDKILSDFQQTGTDRIPVGYLKESGLAGSATSGKNFYIIKRKDVYRRIIGRNRIWQLLPRDGRFHGSSIFSEKGLYLHIDPAILYKAIDLQNMLSAQGYDPDGLILTSGYRTPAYNRKVGGATSSRHLQGDALDFHVSDIDGNGSADDKDKQIVIGLLDRHLIGSRGGVGRYPNTQAIHMDLRGYRARWDSHRRPGNYPGR